MKTARPPATRPKAREISATVTTLDPPFTRNTDDDIQGLTCGADALGRLAPASGSPRGGAILTPRGAAQRNVDGWGCDIYEYITGLIELDAATESAAVTASGWQARLRAPKGRRAVGAGGFEIVLVAQNFRAASKGLQLITAAVGLCSGPLVSELPLLPYSQDDPACTTDDAVAPPSSVATSGLWRACKVAARASRKRKWQYALTKYHFSQSLYGAFLIDLDPRHAEYMALSPLPEVHVRFAHAIMAAHSILEDLGLEIRASANKPSRVGGQWNPVVREDVEGRLVQAGIDIEEPLLWTVRGPRRLLDAKRQIPSRGKYRWSRGWVRDCKVELLDAIAHVDWLRNKVASHGVKALTAALSPYDVVNAQYLARRLILENLGFWKKLNHPSPKKLRSFRPVFDGMRPDGIGCAANLPLQPASGVGERVELKRR